MVDHSFDIVVLGLAVEFEKELAFEELAFVALAIVVLASVGLACAVAYHGDEEALMDHFEGYKLQDLAYRQIRSVVDAAVAVAPDSSSSFEAHFSTVAVIRLVVEGYAGAAGDGAETHRLALVGKQMGCGVGYVGTQLDSGIEEASFEVLQSHDESDSIHRRRRHHHPSFLFH